MRKSKQKSLGQIAHEADDKWVSKLTPWETLNLDERNRYERMAQAVARAVRRRKKEKE